ncbi:hypothetical protein [Amycolatopsis sp. NPDC059021]|uniref:hypothetical protein n=1 Tax=Amycolatopsis sp. NPDC059021 TaxID=3346704 RepID=UPI00366E0CCE
MSDVHGWLSEVDDPDGQGFAHWVPRDCEITAEGETVIHIAVCGARCGLSYSSEDQEQCPECQPHAWW